MGYVANPLTVNRVPKHLDLAFVDATPLTLDIAAPRQMEATYDQCAMRVLTALHEAAHFVAMVDAGDPVFQVMVAPNPITRREGNGGMVCGVKSGMYESEWFTTLVATGVEYVLLSRPNEAHFTDAFIHDYRQSEKEFRVWYEYEIQMGKISGTVEELTRETFASEYAAKRVNQFIRKRWALIDFCATVFLIYGDKRGEVSREVIDALEDVVSARLKSNWPTWPDWPAPNRSTSPTALLNSLPPDVPAIWRKHSPHVEMEDWLDVA